MRIRYLERYVSCCLYRKTIWVKRLDDTLKQSVTNLGKDFQRLKNGLIKCRDYMLNFRSELGTAASLELHSIVETAKKHDLSPYKAIRALWGSTDIYAMAFAK